MKRTIYIVTTWIGVILGFTAGAQNYAEDMLKIRESYKSKYHSFRMSFMFFPYDSLAAASDSVRATCKVKGADYYYDIKDGRNEYEYLKNDKYYLAVDHGNRVVVMNTQNKARPELWNLQKLDSMLNAKTIKAVYKELDNNEAQYELSYSGEAAWNRLRIKFSKVSYTISEIYMYSTMRGKMAGQNYAKPRVGIYYYDYSSASPNESTFSESKYFRSEGDKPELASAYRGYKLLDYIHTRRQ